MKINDDLYGHGSAERFPCGRAATDRPFAVRGAETESALFDCCCFCDLDNFPKIHKAKRIKNKCKKGNRKKQQGNNPEAKRV